MMIMMILARIARFLLWVVVLSWAASLAKRLLLWALHRAEAGRMPGAQAAGSRGQRRLYRDPCCGMYVSDEISYTVKHAEETLHFCSAECRDRYVGTVRRAASG